MIDEWLCAGLSTRADGEHFVRTVKYNLWLCSQYGIEVSDENFQQIVKWLMGEFYGEVLMKWSSNSNGIKLIHHLLKICNSLFNSIEIQRPG